MKSSTMRARVLAPLGLLGVLAGGCMNPTMGDTSMGAVTAWTRPKPETGRRMSEIYQLLYTADKSRLELQADTVVFQENGAYVINVQQELRRIPSKQRVLLLTEDLCAYGVPGVGLLYDAEFGLLVNFSRDTISSVNAFSQDTSTIVTPNVSCPGVAPPRPVPAMRGRYTRMPLDAKEDS